MTLLALKYRPKTFRDLVGQLSVKLILMSFAHSGDCPPAFLFSGPSGTGKTSAARIFAAALNCNNSEKGDSCGTCESCVAIQDGHSTDVHEIDAASNGGIDSIRALQSLAQYSTTGKWRVILLDEAHSMSQQAFNALLKVLEEPPSQTIFVLLTTEPHKILETVKSRAMPIDFRLVPATEMAGRLSFIAAQEEIEIDDDALSEIQSYANGCLRNAVMLLEQASRAGLKTLEDIRQLTGRSIIPLSLTQSILSQDFDKSMTLLDDYFDSSSDLDGLVSGLIQSFQAQFMQGHVSQIQLMSTMKLLWDARGLHTLSRDTKFQMQAMITLLFAVYRPVQQVIPKKTILKVEEPKTPAVEEEPVITSMEELISLVEE